jgi:hypothetical protein
MSQSLSKLTITKEKRARRLEQERPGHAETHYSPPFITTPMLFSQALSSPTQDLLTGR